MTDDAQILPPFEFKSAIGQVFNLPGGMGYLFRVIGAATLILSLAFLLLGVPIVKAYISMFQQILILDTASGTGEPDPAQVFALFQPIMAAMGFITLLYIVQYGTYIAVETALYRNIIRGEDRGLFPLWFGYDEWRVLGTKIVIGLILYGILMMAYLALALVFGVFIGLASSVSGSDGVAIFGGIIFFIAIFALILAMIYVAIRFAPAAAISVRDAQFSPFSSWKMMKSYAWPTIGAVLVVGVIGYFVLSVTMLFAFGGLLFASGIIPFLEAADFDTQTAPDFTPLLDTLGSAGFIIPAILVTIISLFLSLLYMSAIWSIWGYIATLTHWRRGLE